MGSAKTFRYSLRKKLRKTLRFDRDESSWSKVDAFKSGTDNNGEERVANDGV